MTTTLITDGFDGEDEPSEGRLFSGYREKHDKKMTEVAKVLDQARRVYRINERNK